MTHRLKELLVGFALLQCCYFSTVFGQEAAKADWSGDVDFLLDKILTVHPNPFRRHTLSEWQHEAN